MKTKNKILYRVCGWCEEGGVFIPMTGHDDLDRANREAEYQCDIGIFSIVTVEGV